MRGAFPCLFTKSKKHESALYAEVSRFRWMATRIEPVEISIIFFKRPCVIETVNESRRISNRLALCVFPITGSVDSCVLFAPMPESIRPAQAAKLRVRERAHWRLRRSGWTAPN